MHKFVHEVASEFFTTNAPDPLHWTLNSCFGVFHSVSLHLGPFRYYLKLGAIWDELVQLMHKFVLQNRFGIFCNECTRSTPLDPKLMFWCVSLFLGAFFIVLLLDEASCKTGWTGAISAKVCATKSHQNFLQQRHPIHPVGPQTHFLVRLVVFECILDCFVTVRSSIQNGLNWCN